MKILVSTQPIQEVVRQQRHTACTNTACAEVEQVVDTHIFGSFLRLITNQIVLRMLGHKRLSHCELFFHVILLVPDLGRPLTQAQPENFEELDWAYVPHP